MKIDLETGQQVNGGDIKARLMSQNPNTIYNRIDHLTAAELIEIGVGEYIEAAPPDVDYPYSVVESEPDKSEPGIWTQQWEVVSPTLGDAKAFSLARLNAAFDASLQPVEYDGKFWRPGHSSAAVIRDVAEMAELMGLTEVTLTDIDDIEHVYTLANARLVGASIGVAYQQAFLARAAKRRAIADAETPEEALAVTWDDPS